MLKKGLLFLVVLIGMIGLNTGFFNKHMDMKFIQKPDIIQIASNAHEKDINVLIEKYQELQQQQGTETEQATLQQAIQQLYAKDVVQTTDKNIIDLIYNGLNDKNALLGALSNGLKESNAIIDNGLIMPPKSGLYYKLYFQYSVNLSLSTNEEVISAIKKGYMPYIFIFPNNMVYLPVYDSSQKEQISTVKVRLDQDVMEKFEKYYEDNRDKQ